MTKNKQLVNWEANQKAVVSWKPSGVKCFKEEEGIRHVKACWKVKYHEVQDKVNVRSLVAQMGSTRQVEWSGKKTELKRGIIGEEV